MKDITRKLKIEIDVWCTDERHFDHLLNEFSLFTCLKMGNTVDMDSNYTLMISLKRNLLRCLNLLKCGSRRV